MFTHNLFTCPIIVNKAYINSPPPPPILRLVSCRKNRKRKNKSDSLINCTNHLLNAKISTPKLTMHLRWLQPFIFIIVFCSLLVHEIDALPNKRYHISTICSNEKFHSLPKLIDGAVITSAREENLNCMITFTTESVLQKFMLRFEELKLDCNDHLYIYDGDIAVGNPKADLSCRSTRSEVGTIFINGYFVTLKYVTDQWSKQGDGFTLVITAFKDTTSSSSAADSCNLLKCSNMFCISPELACDSVDHCGDNSDEDNNAACPVLDSDIGVIFGLEASAFLGLVIVIFLVCLVCVVSVALCLFKSELRVNSEQRLRSTPAHQHSRMNLLQATPILAHPVNYSGQYATTLSPTSQRFATLPLEKMREKPPPYSGQIYAPIGGSMATSNQNLTGLVNLNSIANLNGIATGTQALPMQQVVYYTGK